MELGVVERFGQGLVREAKGGGGVRASSAEAGRDRDPLVDPHAPGGLPAGPLGELFQGPAHDRVLREAGHLERGCRAPA